MPEFNLLGAKKNVVRDVSARMRNKERNRALALKFDHEYFDGLREQGYGGYVYDGRWVPVAERIVSRYGLKPGMKILDVGCAKGFLMKDLMYVLPGLEVYGIDISRYAIENAMPEVAGQIVQGSCDRLPWADNTFDAVVSINTIHNLDRDGCVRSLQEFERVGLFGKAFVQVDAFRNAEEREAFEAWMLTAKAVYNPEGWGELFAAANYSGDFFWTILETGPQTIFE